MNKTSFVIEGKRSIPQNKIWVDGKELIPELSQKIRNHSPDGFNWGYGGSGPAQAALGICLEIFKERWMAQALYQQFKWAFVSRWNEDEFHVVIDVSDFLIDNRNLIHTANENRCEDF